MKQFQNEINSLSTSVQAEPAALIMDVIPLIMSYIRSEMRSRRMPGLSIPQFRSLIYLYRHEDASLSQVSEHVGLKLPSTSKMIDALVERKLVIRKTSATDRRFVKLKLSATGEAELAKARRSTETQLAEILSALTPEQQDNIIASLEELRSLFAVKSNRQANTEI